MAYKVFSNGSVLNASDLNDYLMNQSVMVFSSSTARASAIATPIEGMLTYLEDTNAYEYWDGSAWVAFGGGGGGGDFTLVARTSFSAVAGQNFDNVFTSDYAVYRVVVENIFSSTAGDTLEFQTRVGGVTRTNSYYGAIGTAIFNSTGYNGTLNTNNAASLRIGTANLGPNTTTLSFDIYNVGTSAVARLTGNGLTGEMGIVTFFGGYRLATEVVDGFRLFGPAGNITGTVAIYGYGK